MSITEWDYLKKQIPTWQQVFLEADAHTKRVLVDKLIERIDIKKNRLQSASVFVWRILLIILERTEILHWTMQQTRL